MPRSRSSASEHLIKLHSPIETDWEYWIIHVVHWHALLVAIIVVLSFGYFFFNQNRVLAVEAYTSEISSVYPQ